MSNQAHLCWSDRGLQKLGSRKHLQAPSCPPKLFMFSLASFILFPIRSPPAPAYNISICQSLGYFGNAVLKLLSHVSGPPLCGWQGNMARESGSRLAGLGTIEFSFSHGEEGEAQRGGKTTRAHSCSLRGDPVPSQLNTWAEIPEACGTPSFPPYWGVMPRSSRFLFLEANIEYLHNKMVLCQAL